jgi:hypothetical protein
MKPDRSSNKYLESHSPKAGVDEPGESQGALILV